MERKKEAQTEAAKNDESAQKETENNETNETNESEPSIQSEDIDAIFNEPAGGESKKQLIIVRPNGDIVCNIESGEAETTSNSIQAADPSNVPPANNPDNSSVSSVRSIGSIACRICHNAENPEKLVSPCDCRGTLAYVHVYCLERWISTSRCTTCELCHFEYQTEQRLRYSCLQSLRLYYSRHASRRTLQEDCQMFSMLTLVAFGIVGTLLVGLQYYLLQGNIWGIGRIWTKGWLLFFLFTTLAVYLVNIYLLGKSQLVPWYRWWQSARDIKLILENRCPIAIERLAKLQLNQILNAENRNAGESEPQNESENTTPSEPLNEERNDVLSNSEGPTETSPSEQITDNTFKLCRPNSRSTDV